MEIFNIKAALERRAALKGAMRAVDIYAACLPRDMQAKMKREIKDQHRETARRDHLTIIK